MTSAVSINSLFEFLVMANPDFSSARLKIKRAKQHIAEVEGWVSQFIELNRDRPRLKIEFGAGDKAGKIGWQFHKNKFPDVELSVIVGDVVHNLRAALDHAAAAILSANGVDPQKAAFPIDKDRKSLVGKTEFREIERLAPKLAGIILENVCDSSTSNILVGMNHLDRADKHRRLLVSEAETSFGILCIDDEDNPPLRPQNDIFVLPGGVPPSVGSAAQLHNYNYSQSPGQIVFGKGEPFEREPIVPTLFQISQVVEMIVNKLESPFE